MKGDPLAQVRAICLALPEAEERLSHGEPTFFVRGKVFCMYADNHHGDGHVAVWIPAAHGMQETLIARAPDEFFRPPYVGHRGWVGVEIGAVPRGELQSLIHNAWTLIAPRRLVASAAPSGKNVRTAD